MDINNILHGQVNAVIMVQRDDLIEFANTYAKLVASKHTTQDNNSDQEKPISQPEAVKFLGKTRQTLIKWRKRGIIKGHVLGGRIYYLKSELLAALNMSTK